VGYALKFGAFRKGTLVFSVMGLWRWHRREGVVQCENNFDTVCGNMYTIHHHPRNIYKEYA
jgi:hypothetical protein